MNLKDFKSDEEIVCLCKELSLGDLKAAIAGGADTMEKLREETGVGKVCGACREIVYELLDEMA